MNRVLISYIAEGTYSVVINGNLFLCEEGKVPELINKYNCTIKNSQFDISLEDWD